MPQGPSVQRDQLENAFQVFNQVSGQLVDSYQVLQSQVSRLTEELAASRGERMRELAEKTRLANRITRLLETLPAAVVVLDGEDRVQQINPAAKELFPSIKIGVAWKVVVEREFLPGQTGEERWLRQGRLVSATSRTLQGEPGAIHLFLDVTETRELQARIEQQHRLTVMGEMAAQLAHQIRTPLSSAMLYNRHLAKDDLSHQQRIRFSSRCADRLRHIERQVTDMLSFARGGQFETCLLPFEALLEELRQMASPLFRESECELSISKPNLRNCLLQGNMAALVGALLNLLVNALENGAKQVEMAVRIIDKKSIRISISDDGSGIPSDLQETIFDPFFTTRSDGTGLGLPVVRLVVLAHHGEIDVQSTPGQGTCFSVQLPLCLIGNSASGLSTQE